MTAWSHSSYLFLQLYDPAMTPERLAELASRYDHSHVQPFLPREPRWNVSREPSRPLRIGFVSSDLREHPVGFFMTGVLEHLDRTELRRIAIPIIVATTCGPSDCNEPQACGAWLINVATTSWPR